jgi:asparagine synthase (glutamine-hydrolysing)
LQFGFVSSCDSRQIEFQLFESLERPEADKLVTLSQRDGCVSIVAGRLHYRKEALDKLAADLSSELIEECNVSDAALALGLYLKYGTRGVAQLEGDFAVVIWNGKEHCFIARRDPFGAYPLFWMKDGRTVAFSTAMKPLTDMRPSCAISLDHLADFLVVPTSSNERNAEACAFENIQRVMPDVIVSIDVTTGQVSRETYSNWSDKLAQVVSGDLAEVASQYRDLLREAVRQRISRATAAHMSGGMDSTSVCLLALDLICDGYGRPPLHSLSLVYDRLPTLAKERSYIESVLGVERKGLIGHRVVADDILHFGILLDPPAHDEPFAGLWAMGPDSALIDKAAALGVTTLLTGVGADDLLDMWPNHLADLLHKGSVIRAWKDAGEWAKARNSTPWRILRLFGFAHAFPSLRHSLRELIPVTVRRGSLRNLDDWSVAPWIRPDFTRRYSLSARIEENLSRLYRTGLTTPASLALHSIERRVGDRYRTVLAAPKGVALSHPFLDSRVVSFVLGLQEKILSPSEQTKPVLAKAMRDILPPNIRDRRDKRSFNEVYYLGLSRYRPGLEAMIAQSPIDDLGMIDKEILRRSLEEAALGVADPRKLQRLNLTLSLIAWLSAQRRWQSGSNPPTHSVRMPIR